MHRTSKVNVLLLALCQAFSMTGATVLFTTAALIGQSLATNKALATVPLALFQIATMLVTIPASLLMQRFGRRFGFAIGILVGIGGSGLAMHAILTKSFVLFCCATVLLGSSSAFAGFYRFAAAEVASEAFRSQAIALVISGGVVAAIAGPQLASWSKDWLSTTFAGSMITIAVLQLVSLAFLAPVKLPGFSSEELTDKGRSLPVILTQPIFVVAVLSSMIGYGVMILVMTATPLAIVADAHPFHHAAMVIQWHVLGMFAPSFVTGSLIARFGVLNILTCGGLLSLLCLTMNLLGSGLVNYAIALLLLGVGWNFLFIGGTTLLTQTYQPVEKARVQATHDFLMFAFVALATMLSGTLFQLLGWYAVNWAGLPLLVLVLVAVQWLRRQPAIVLKN
jgi:MFS family permease